MKVNYILRSWHIERSVIHATIIVLALSWAVCGRAANTNDVAYKIGPGDIITSVRANNTDAFDKVAALLQNERQTLNNELVNVFQDPKSPSLSRGAAAYYLGVLHVSEAANVLAANITFQVNQLTTDHLTMLQGPVAMNALIRIGTAAIPPVIRNLENSVDPEVKHFSLLVLSRIDGDKDISQLRLQKALKAQTDPQKKARLESALKTLAADSFRN
jgi:hypothetical protein